MWDFGVSAWKVAFRSAVLMKLSAAASILEFRRLQDSCGFAKSQAQGSALLLFPLLDCGSDDSNSNSKRYVDILMEAFSIELQFFFIFSFAF